MSKAVLILGASSSIARATAQELANKGFSLYLAGRDLLDLERIARDLRIRSSVKIKCGYFAAEIHEELEGAAEFGSQPLAKTQLNKDKETPHQHR